MTARNFTMKKRTAVKTGACESCKTREGKDRIIPGHVGCPVLCTECYDKRKARVERNKRAFHEVPDWAMKKDHRS